MNGFKNNYWSLCKELQSRKPWKRGRKIQKEEIFNKEQGSKNQLVLNE